MLADFHLCLLLIVLTASIGTAQMQPTLALQLILQHVYAADTLTQLLAKHSDCMQLHVQWS